MKSDTISKAVKLLYQAKADLKRLNKEGKLSGTEHLYKAAKEFVEEYEKEKDEGDGKS